MLHCVNILRDCSASGYTGTTILRTNVSSLQCARDLIWCRQTMELTTNLLW